MFFRDDAPRNDAGLKIKKKKKKKKKDTTFIYFNAHIHRTIEYLYASF